jgi:hypothetical protein
MKSNIQNAQEICLSALTCIYDFQTLIASGVALLAAVVGGWCVLRAAKLPVEAENKRNKNALERRRKFSCHLLSEEFKRIGELARQAEGTIKVVIAANADVTETTRKKTIIIEPPFLDDWETMSLLSQEALARVMEVRAILRKHNFDMNRAGGSFGDDNFQVHVRKQAETLGNAAKALADYLKNESLKKQA